MFKYKMKNREWWTEEQNRFLINNYLFNTNKQLADKMNNKFKTKRSPNSIKCRLKKLQKLN